MSLDFTPSNAAAICGWYISYIYRKSGAFFTSQLKMFDLSAMQSIVLTGIYRHQGINQRALGELVAVAPSVISRVLRELEDKGCILKERDESNRRNYNLYLTPVGEELVKKSSEIQKAYWGSLLEDFSPQEIETLNHMLSKIEKHTYE